MTKLTEVEDSDYRHIMVFGPPKSGKTELVGKLSKHFNLVWFDLENGYKTLRKLPREQQERIDLIRIPDTRSFPIASETMLKVIKGNRVSICQHHGKVTCPECFKEKAPENIVELSSLQKDTIVVVDSTTQLSNSAIAHITRKQKEDYKLDWDDYYRLGMLMDVFFSHAQNAPFNIICISHDVDCEKDEHKTKMVPIAGTGKFSRTVSKYFDDVVYCELKNGKHVIGSSTTYSPIILTGSRSGLALESHEELDLYPLFTGQIVTKVKEIEKAENVKVSSKLSALADQLKR